MSGTLGTRVKERRTEIGLSTEKLAYLTGITRVAIVKIECDQTKNARADTLFAMAAALKCSPKWLLFGEGPKEDNGISDQAALNYVQSANHNALSVLPFEQIESIGSLTPADQEEFEKIHSPIALENGFSLKVKDDSMFPSFLEGDYLVVELNKKPKDGDFVIASHSTLSIPTFKQYKMIDGIEVLQATNPSYPSDFKFIRMDNTSKILGVVVSQVRLF